LSVLSSPQPSPHHLPYTTLFRSQAALNTTRRITRLSHTSKPTSTAKEAYNGFSRVPASNRAAADLRTSKPTAPSNAPRHILDTERPPPDRRTKESRKTPMLLAIALTSANARYERLSYHEHSIH